MPSPLPLPSTEIKLRLYNEDVAFLQTHFPRKVNEVVRERVHALVQRLRADPRYLSADQIADPLDMGDFLA